LGEWLSQAIDWVLATVHEWGYTGIVVMMTIESSFIPFPSEVAMIPAGYLAAQGRMDPVLATLAGLLGSLIGAFVNYALAYYLGRPAVERIAGWFYVGVDKIESADRFFARHGEITTFVGRLIPVIRQLISLPAGFARMNLAKFAFYTGLGAGLWCTVLVGVGYWVGANEELWRPLLQEVTLWLLGGVALLLVGYIWYQRRREVRG
jgi:membrane protein DedA with SNARE-associated domain